MSPAAGGPGSTPTPSGCDENLFSLQSVAGQEPLGLAGSRRAPCQNAGWTPRFGEVDRALPHSMARLLDQALEEDCSRIVVVGGDGTLHRALNLLSRKGGSQSVELAVVPAGHLQ